MVQYWNDNVFSSIASNFTKQYSHQSNSKGHTLPSPVTHQSIVVAWDFNQPISY